MKEENEGMSTDRFTELLSDYLDHDLPRAEYDAVERHLASCTECRETLAGLVSVKARAASLVDPPAPTDLWAGIASRIGTAGSTREAPARRAQVLELPRPRRATWAAPQWIMAAAAFVVVAAGAVWIASDRMSPRTAARTEATAASFDAGQIETEIHDLQAALERGKGKLAPETVQVLEENLRIIHKALDDARTALAQDPANRELQDYLAGSVQRKLDMVKRAAELAGV
jgi:anti-sigma factor RsiW